MGKKKRAKRIPQKPKRSFSVLIWMGLVLLLLCFIGHNTYDAIMITKARQNLQSWFKVSYGEGWTTDELKAWDKLIYKSVPKIEKYLGRPPYEISAKILKGETDTFGGKIVSGAKIQEINCPSPITSPSICLHEIAHLFFHGHQPEHIFFREGIIVYLQKIIGDKLNYNHGDDRNYPEYFYNLQPNYTTANKTAIAPFNNTDFAGIVPVSRIRYGLYAYFWHTLYQRNPGSLKLIAKALWEAPVNNKGIINTKDCLHLANQCIPGFNQWYQDKISLHPNPSTGLRLLAFNGPRPEDLMICCWLVERDQEGRILDYYMDFPFIAIEVYKKNKKVLEKMVDLRNSNRLESNFVKKIKREYGSPVLIRVEAIDAFKQTNKPLVDTVEIQ